MIKIDSITIEEFRGIRSLTLDFKQKNFAVCGPNGTGKSGIVDALEFVLTGNISRLSGEGRGEISLKQHAPHVDKRNNAEKARVIARVFIPSLKKAVTVERNVKTPGVVQVTPNEPAVLAILKHVEMHPEIVLSRRELIRYVLATPGKRAEEVQALLHLDDIAQVRSGLQKIANSVEKQVITLDMAVKSAVDSLSRALIITELTAANILQVTNAQRAILGLPALPEFTATVSLKDGISAPVPAKAQSIPKKQALADIAASREVLAEIADATTIKCVIDVVADVEALAADSTLATGVTRESFYSTGLSLIDNESCPFCDTIWDVAALRQRAQSKLDALKGLLCKRKNIEKKIAPLIVTLRKTQAVLDTLIRYAALAKPPLEMKAISSYRSDCQISSQILHNFIPLADTMVALKNIPIVPPSVHDDISRLEKIVVALPESSKQDAARDFLTIAQERLDAWRDAKRKQKVSKTQAERARQISDIFAATSDSVLVGLYSNVQKDFATLYTFINRTDEKDFAAKLVPSMGKLGFEVDFYGRGFFPPGAYHSEGHQDGMGVCLYLALMRHLQGNEFTFAVLDDVLMSVDTGHRREVCALLKKEFPNTQFIMTTHDPIWLRHMKTVALIGSRSAVQFRTWNVDHGPTEWDDRDVWTEVDDYLKRNEVRAAAALLRNYLEYTATEICHQLRAPVQFRADGQYQLGELLPASISRLRKLYVNAKEAANSWGQKDIVVSLTGRDSEFTKLVSVSQVEQWQVNVAIHYNAWDNLTKEDFAPVVKSLHALLSGFVCSECGQILYVSPERETAESLRCDCGKTNINLCKKTA